MSEKRYDDILLISDLDGTLIPRHEAIADENLAALNAFTAAGGAFAAATGRTPEAALPYLDGITEGFDGRPRARGAHTGR